MRILADRRTNRRTAPLRKAAFCTYLFIDIRYSLFTFVRCRSLLDVTWSQSSNVSKLRNNVLIYILFRDFSHVQQRTIWILELGSGVDHHHFE